MTNKKNTSITRGDWALSAPSQRITVQVLNMISGEIREVTANVKAATEQDAVNFLFSIAKDEKAYKYLGRDGILSPVNATPTQFPNYPGDWFAKA